jgi:hypothetical protein
MCCRQIYTAKTGLSRTQSKEPQMFVMQSFRERVQDRHEYFVEEDAVDLLQLV